MNIYEEALKLHEENKGNSSLFIGFIIGFSVDYLFPSNYTFCSTFIGKIREYPFFVLIGGLK